MGDEDKKKLEQKLWDIANELPVEARDVALIIHSCSLPNSPHSIKIPKLFIYDFATPQLM